MKYRSTFITVTICRLQQNEAMDSQPIRSHHTLPAKLWHVIVRLRLLLRMPADEKRSLAAISLMRKCVLLGLVLTVESTMRTITFSSIVTVMAKFV